MMVMEVTRLPKRAASVGEPVTLRAMEAPAEKLSPAPQMSTGWATGRVRTHSSADYSGSLMGSTPSAPPVTNISFD
jgi:hypothetical protein